MSAFTTEQIMRAGPPLHLFTNTQRNIRRHSRSKSSTKSPTRTKSSTKSPTRSDRTLVENASDEASPPKKLSLARRASAAAVNLGKAAASPSGLKVGAAAAVIGGGLLAKRLMDNKKARASASSNALKNGATSMLSAIHSDKGIEYQHLDDGMKRYARDAMGSKRAILDTQRFRISDNNIFEVYRQGWFFFPDYWDFVERIPRYKLSSRGEALDLASLDLSSVMGSAPEQADTTRQIALANELVNQTLAKGISTAAAAISVAKAAAGRARLAPAEETVAAAVEESAAAPVKEVASVVWAKTPKGLNRRLRRNGNVLKSTN